MVVDAPGSREDRSEVAAPSAQVVVEVDLLSGGLGELTDPHVDPVVVEV